MDYFEIAYFSFGFPLLPFEMSQIELKTGLASRIYKLVTFAKTLKEKVHLCASLFRS